MKNTKDMKIETLKFLIYGGMGTGKTRFAGTFPKPVMLDFDKGGLSLKSAGVNVDYEDWLGEDYDHAKVLKFIKEHTTSGKYETIILDSLTTLAGKVMEYVLRLNNRANGRPVMQDWGDQMRHIKEIIFALTNSPIHCVVIAHDQMDSDEITGRKVAAPLVTGKLSREIPVFFDEIYYSEKVTKGIESSYRLLTKHSGLYPARSRLNLQEYITPDFKEIEKVISKGEEGKKGV